MRPLWQNTGDTTLLGLNGYASLNRVWFSGSKALKQGMQFRYLASWTGSLPRPEVFKKNVKAGNERSTFVVQTTIFVWKTTYICKRNVRNQNQGIRIRSLVFNRVLKWACSLVSVLNRVRVWGPRRHISTHCSIKVPPLPCRGERIIPLRTLPIGIWFFLLIFKLVTVRTDRVLL